MWEFDENPLKEQGDGIKESHGKDRGEERKRERER